MKIKNIRKYYLYFVVYSIVGWIYEVIWFLIKKHKFINRGFLFGPYLPIYGFGAIIIILLLTKLKDKKIKIKNINITPIIIFIMIILIATPIEYISHFILDEFFHIKLWNYSHEFLNINGRVCLETSLLFGVGGFIVLYFTQKKLDKFLKKIPDKIRTITAILLGIAMIIDLLLKLVK